MKEFKKALPFLESILSSVNIASDEDAQLVFDYPSIEQTTLEVKVKRDKDTVSLPVYLPTREIQKMKLDKKLVFFPFAESIFNGNSEMLNMYLRLVGIRLHMSTAMLLEALVNTAIDKEDKSYGNEIIDILKGVGIKKTVAAKVKKLISAIASDKPYGPNSLVKLCLDRNPKGNSRRQTYPKFIDTEAPRFGKEVPSQQVRDILQQLLEGIFQDEKEYIGDSNSGMCPSFFATLKGFALIATRINEVAEDLGVHKNESIIISDDWFHMLADEKVLEKFHTHEIRAKFEGNVGVGKYGTKEEAPRPTTKKTKRKLGFSSAKRVEKEESHNEHIEELQDVVEEIEEIMEANEPGAGLTFDTGKYASKPRARQPRQSAANTLSTQHNGLKVVKPKNKRSKTVDVHAVDMTGEFITWESGEPYIVQGEGPMIPFVWQRDASGNPLFLQDGEPALQPTAETRQMHEYNKMNGGTANRHYGHNVHTPASRGRMYSPEELATMGFSERRMAEKEMAEAQGYHGHMGGHMTGHLPAHNGFAQQPATFMHGHMQPQQHAGFQHNAFHQQPMHQQQPATNFTGFGTQSSPAMAATGGETII